jgi:hypothetical protein
MQPKGSIRDPFSQARHNRRVALLDRVTDPDEPSGVQKKRTSMGARPTRAEKDPTAQVIPEERIEKIETPTMRFFW